MCIGKARSVRPGTSWMGQSSNRQNWLSNSPPRSAKPAARSRLEIAPPHHPKSTVLVRRAGSVLENADGAGDPPVAVNPRQVATLRASGALWKVISRELGIKRRHGLPGSVAPGLRIS